MSYVIIKPKASNYLNSIQDEIIRINNEDKIIYPINTTNILSVQLRKIKQIKLKHIGKAMCKMIFTILFGLLILCILSWIGVTIYNDLKPDGSSENTDTLIKGVEAQALIDTSTQFEIRSKDGVTIVPQNNGTYHYSSRFHHYPGFYADKLVKSIPYRAENVFFLNFEHIDGQMTQAKVAWSNVKKLVYGFTGEMFIAQSADTVRFGGVLSDLPAEANYNGLIYDQNKTLVTYVNPTMLNKLTSSGEGTILIPIPSFSITSGSYRYKCSKVEVHNNVTLPMIYGREQFATKQDLVSYINKIETEMRINKLLPINDLTYEIHVWRVGSQPNNRDRIVLTNNFGLEISHTYIPK